MSVYRKEMEPVGRGTNKISPICIKNIYIHTQTDPELLDTSVPFTNSLLVENKFKKPSVDFNSNVFDNSNNYPSYRDLFLKHYNYKNKSNTIHDFKTPNLQIYKTIM